MAQTSSTDRPRQDNDNAAEEFVTQIDGTLTFEEMTPQQRAIYLHTGGRAVHFTLRPLRELIVPRNRSVVMPAGYARDLIVPRNRSVVVPAGFAPCANSFSGSAPQCKSPVVEGSTL